MKKRGIFLCVVSVSVLINVILFYILKGKVGIDNIRSIDLESFKVWVAKALFAVVIICKGLLAYASRRKGNYLTRNGRIGIRVSLYDEVKDYAVAEEYKKEFFWQFCIYWFVIPFYFTFLSLHWDEDAWILLWIFGVFLIPIYAYFICDMRKEKRIGKMLKIRKQKREQELKEQLMREELGHYK